MSNEEIETLTRTIETNNEDLRRLIAEIRKTVEQSPVLNE